MGENRTNPAWPTAVSARAPARRRSRRVVGRLCSVRMRPGLEVDDVRRDLWVRARLPSFRVVEVCGEEGRVLEPGAPSRVDRVRARDG